MSHQEISSLHSPHVERVKALLGSRGKKIRTAEHVFVADGMQSLRGALQPKTKFAPHIQKIFVTAEGRAKLESELAEQMEPFDVVNVSDAVMNAMTETAQEGLTDQQKEESVKEYLFKQFVDKYKDLRMI